MIGNALPMERALRKLENTVNHSANRWVTTRSLQKLSNRESDEENIVLQCVCVDDRQTSISVIIVGLTHAHTYTVLLTVNRAAIRTQQFMRDKPRTRSYTSLATTSSRVYALFIVLPPPHPTTVGQWNVI